MLNNIDAAFDVNNTTKISFVLSLIYSVNEVIIFDIFHCCGVDGYQLSYFGDGIIK